MFSLEKLKMLTPLQNLPKNVGNLGKILSSVLQEIRKKVMQQNTTRLIVSTAVKSG